MHIPDNYLSPSTCAVMGAVMLPIWGRAVKKVKQEVTKKKMPLLGIGGAFSFLIMMFNIPLPGSTTGHAVGGTLVAILLGPEAACISISIALLIQALLFGDGGVLAFGANSFNMAFVLPFSGYYIYRFVNNRLKNERKDYISAFIGSYVGINLAALFTAVEFGIQPLLFKDAFGMPLYSPYSLSVSIPALLIPHIAIIGILEAVITAGVFAYIKKISPDIIYEASAKKASPIYGFIAALIILTPIGLLANGTAWGEWSAAEIKSAAGFVPKAMRDGFSFESVMPAYSVNGTPKILGYILSAAAGAAILIILFKLISIKKKSVNNH